MLVKRVEDTMIMGLLTVEINIFVMKNVGKTINPSWGWWVAAGLRQTYSLGNL